MNFIHDVDKLNNIFKQIESQVVENCVGEFAGCESHKSIGS